MSIHDGTARYAIMNLNSRGLDCDTYSSIGELITDKVRQTVFDWTKPYRRDDMSEDEWMNMLHKAKKIILKDLEDEVNKAIKSEAN